MPVQPGKNCLGQPGDRWSDHRRVGKRTEPPYRFVWIPPMAKDYSVSAIVRDVAGNVNSTEESILCGQLRRGRVSLTVLGDSNYSIEAGGQFLVSVESTSEYGVAEVEFFIDNQSVGTAYDSGGISFQKVINLADLILIKESMNLPLLPETSGATRLAPSLLCLPIFHRGKTSASPSCLH